MKNTKRSLDDYVCHYPGCIRQRREGDWCQAHRKQLKLGRKMQPLLTRGKPATRPTECSFQGCEDYARGHGFCSGHLHQARKGEELKPKRMSESMAGVICMFPSCGLDAKTKRMCNSHYSQFLRNGDLLPIGATLDCAIRFCDARVTQWAKGDLCPSHVRLARQSGLGRDGIVALWEARGDICWACGTNTRRLHMDHDHSCCPIYCNKKCGKCIRGLLCQRCNNVLGHVKESRELLSALSNYLDRGERLPSSLP